MRREILLGPALVGVRDQGRVRGGPANRRDPLEIAARRRRTSP